MPEMFRHGYALLIGVGACAYTQWSLPATVKDAEAIRRTLADRNLCAYSPKQLRLLKDKAAARKGILDGLAWLKACAEDDQEATVVVFYSGHGWLDNTSGGYYLIPSDTSPLRAARTALSAADLTAALRAIPAKRLLVVLDSCHAAGMATAAKKAGIEEEPSLPEGFTAGALPKGLSEDLAQGQGRAVFTSSSGAQLSWVRKDGSMSVYTFHLIEALEGAGNREGEKLVKLSDLMGYLSQAVPETVRQECGEEQTPNFDFKTEDFPVAVLRGGKGLPRGGWAAVQREKEATAPPSDVTQAVGERSVAIGRGSHNTVITGDRNIVGSSNIQVGNIRDSVGVNIGQGAGSTTINTGGGDFVGRDKITGAQPRDMAEAFGLLYEKVNEHKTGVKRPVLHALVQQLEEQARKGEQAEPAEVLTLFQTLKAMAGDIFEVAVATFSSPVQGISTVFQKIAQKAKGRRTFQPKNRQAMNDR
jgi:hypothetical protein